MHLSPSEIQEIMKRDFINLTGIDGFGVSSLNELFSYNNTMSLLFDESYFRECRNILCTNISKVCSEYFIYNPEHIEDPIEHYKGIVNNKEKIEEIICTNLCDEIPKELEGLDPKEFIYEGGGMFCEPYKVLIRNNTLDCLSYLGDNLVGVGQGHKFDPQLAYEYLYRKDEGEENQEG